MSAAKKKADTSSKKKTKTTAKKTSTKKKKGKRTSKKKTSLKKTSKKKTSTKAASKKSTSKKSTPSDPMQWWREARFGMFIHWGLYAVPAGRWKNVHIPGIGEWIMNRAEIPIKQYEKLAKKFNPVKFDAEKWVKLAKGAGMKYLVITAKHHDGFAMFDSKVSSYNIVRKTPWHHDPMADLAKACRKHGLKLCFYYSQALDWHHPDAVGNTWDFPDEDEKNFARYLREKVKPQLEELLTNYGDIGLIWFDVPQKISRRQSRDLKKFVHGLQADCLVSGRVGHDLGDYGSLGDNQMPAGRLEGDWETPATMNDTWGYKIDDKNWKSVDTLLQLLVDLASKGVNYLLNVGPTARGTIPYESVKRLEQIGRWMDINGRAIYGTSASPWPYEFHWGRVTRKPGKLYLLFYEWPRGEFVLRGLGSTVTGARLLGRKDTKVDFRQREDDKGKPELVLSLDARKRVRRISVVELDIDGDLEVDESPFQQSDGRVVLPAHIATMHRPKSGSRMEIARDGVTENWVNTRNWLSWQFHVSTPGSYEVRIITSGPKYARWRGGHKMQVAFKRNHWFEKALKADEHVYSTRSQVYPEAASVMGRVHFEKPGRQNLKLRATSINKNLPGINLVGVELLPVED